MNNLPIWYILSFAWKTLEDAEAAANRKDFELAEAWQQQTVGLWRLIADYRANGGTLSEQEDDRFDALCKMQDKLSDRIPEFTKEG